MQITCQYREIMDILDKAETQKAAFILLKSPNQVFIMDQDTLGYTYITGSIFASHPVVMSRNNIKNLRTMLMIYDKRQKEKGMSVSKFTALSIEEKRIEILHAGDVEVMDYESNLTQLSYDNKISTQVEKLSSGLTDGGMDYVSFNPKDLRSFMSSFEKSPKEIMLEIKGQDVSINKRPIFGEVKGDVSHIKLHIPKKELRFLIDLANNHVATDIVIGLSDKILVLEMHNNDNVVCKIHKKHLM